MTEMFVNKQLDTQFFYMYVYFYSPHFWTAMCPSGELYRCGIWYMSLYVDDRLVCRSICFCIPDGHLHTVTCTRCRIDTFNSPDGHITVGNMWRIEINIHEKELCVSLVICKDHTEMHSQ